MPKHTHASASTTAALDAAGAAATAVAPALAAAAHTGADAAASATCPPTPPATLWPTCVLALDASTERLSLAVGAAGAAPLAEYQGAGGAQASDTLLPRLLELLQQVGWRLHELDAIAFGHGPGAFTGLRSACAVVQGLAFAARPGGVPVLPIGTLDALALAALLSAPQTPPTPPAPLAPQTGPRRVLAALDARMDEVYCAAFDIFPTPAWPAAALQVAPALPTLLQPGWRLQPLSAPQACAPEGLPLAHLHAADGSATWLVGNAWPLYGARLPQPWQRAPRADAWPTAAALLRLAAAAWERGAACSAAAAQPLYVRDQVALTTQQREQRQREGAESASR